MPAPITHIVLGKKIHQKFFSHLDFPSFIVGTSFPDIHYFSSLKREQTHSKNMQLKDIETQNAFLAGFQVHSLVDLVANKFGQKQMLSFSLEQNRENGLALKFYQDKILYPKINNWPEIQSFFNHTYTHKITPSISKEEVQEWHNWLQKYFEKGAVKKCLKIFNEKINNPELTPKVLQSLKNIEKNTNIKKGMATFSEKIISLIEKR